MPVCIYVASMEGEKSLDLHFSTSLSRMHDIKSGYSGGKWSMGSASKPYTLQSESSVVWGQNI